MGVVWGQDRSNGTHPGDVVVNITLIMPQVDYLHCILRLLLEIERNATALLMRTESMWKSGARVSTLYSLIICCKIESLFNLWNISQVYGNSSSHEPPSKCKIKGFVCFLLTVWCLLIDFIWSALSLASWATRIQLIFRQITPPKCGINASLIRGCPPACRVELSLKLKLKIRDSLRGNWHFDKSWGWGTETHW